MNTRNAAGRTLHRFSKAPLLLAALLATAVLTAACASEAAPTPTQPSGPLGPASEPGPRDVSALGAQSAGLAVGGGIHASGYGVASGVPDIVVLSLGVEATATTVSEARDAAARAFDAIVAALRSAGVADDDIRTTQFSVYPRYDYRSDSQQLIGFQVSNSLSVTVRDIDGAGDVVDRAVEAGGDLTRIHGVSFQVEDTAALEREARISALQDAVDKADLYAEQLGVSRGALISVSESGSDPYPFAVAESRMAFDSAMAAPSTEFFAGELEVSVRVQVVFGIQ